MIPPEVAKPEAVKDEISTPKVIVGLGNPGKEYQLTRHNLGFLVVQAFVEAFGGTFCKEAHFESFHAKVKVDGQSVDVLMPLTYMNHSGRAVAKFINYYKLKASDVLVVVDDMALQFGQMRLKSFGGTGGHNGLKSIQACLGTEQYSRLRLGIGHARHAHVDHVLGRFTEDERIHLPEYINRATSALKRIFQEDFERVANDINRKIPDSTSC